MRAKKLTDLFVERAPVTLCGRIEYFDAAFRGLALRVTYMPARIEFSSHVVDKVLNHVSGTIRGVAAVYNRFEYLLEERRAALEAWGRQVEKVVSPRSRTSRRNEAANSKTSLD